MIWPILVIVFDENGAPRLSARPFLFEDDSECERNVETCIRGKENGELDCKSLAKTNAAKMSPQQEGLRERELRPAQPEVPKRAQR
ncbi:hypothetical protein D623_10025744 [Myotis brandtii]|uniref:Uncharacterized protein n=1 Tax=Myotis brandtii TaxID=109478 RepID=S7Q8L7_MYOBR|nr:hypothetical protein D623_10025744 [Myotis brandtii]